MNIPYINISHLRELTIEYGVGWGYPHVCRVLRLAQEIGTDIPYDESAFPYAAYLHDWGSSGSPGSLPGAQTICGHATSAFCLASLASLAA